MFNLIILISVNKGDRIAQLICERIYIPELEECEVKKILFNFFYGTVLK